jgi:hypothetical protein
LGLVPTRMPGVNFSPDSGRSIAWFMPYRGGRALRQRKGKELLRNVVLRGSQGRR